MPNLPLNLKPPTHRSLIKSDLQGKRPVKTTNNDSYCWLHGYQVAKFHVDATCNMKESGHQDAANKSNSMGGVQWGKERCREAAKVIDDILNQFALSLDCAPSFTDVTKNATAILDSWCTSNFLSAAAPCSDKQAAHILLNFNIPNGTIIQSSHTCNLLLPDLPPQARQAHILPGLVHNSLISVGQLCHNGCSVTFTQDQVTVSINEKCVAYGSRDPK
jgi:hypothetical protein